MALRFNVMPPNQLVFLGFHISSHDESLVNWKMAARLMGVYELEMI